MPEVLSQSELRSRSLVISDTHLGSWLSNDLLKYDFALERLRVEIKKVDEVILNGDIFELCFQRLETSLNASEPFLKMLKEELQGKRVVYIPGNHDHHLVVKTLEDLIELKLATGATDKELSEMPLQESFIEKYLKRKLEGVEVKMTYPTYECHGVLVTHGHYLDTHVKGSMSSFLLQRTAWKMIGAHKKDELTIEDYEALLTPMYELYYQVAQLPTGTAAQEIIWKQLQKLGSVIQVTTSVSKGAKSAYNFGVQQYNNISKRDKEAFTPDNINSILDSPSELLYCFQKVKHNLDWNYDKIVFSHSHQPLAGVVIPGDSTTYYNTGSWFYDKKNASRKDYLERAWPGTIIIISNNGEVTLKHLLSDFNPENIPFNEII